MINLKQYLSTGKRIERETATGRVGRSDVEQRARYMAEQICTGFQLHDYGQREEAIEAFYEVDKHQFAHATNDDAYRAARSFVDALWEKDDVEKAHLNDGVVDPESVGDGEWKNVSTALEQRASAVGMDRRYAEKTTAAWCKHKTGDDYWSSFLEAQTYELRCAMQDPTYPDKPKEGLSGYGPISTRYLLAVELHDMHTQETWEEAIRVMVPYYEAVLLAQRGEWFG